MQILSFILTTLTAFLTFNLAETLVKHQIHIKIDDLNEKKSRWAYVSHFWLVSMVRRWNLHIFLIVFRFLSHFWVFQPMVRSKKAFFRKIKQHASVDFFAFFEFGQNPPPYNTKRFEWFLFFLIIIFVFFFANQHGTLESGILSLQSRKSAEKSDPR